MMGFEEMCRDLLPIGRVAFDGPLGVASAPAAIDLLREHAGHADRLAGVAALAGVLEDLAGR